MTHLRIDNAALNKDAHFECGIAWPLPGGDLYVFEGEYRFHMVTCSGCGGGPPMPLGTLASDISTNPDDPRYAEWLRISRSWGYE